MREERSDRNHLDLALSELFFRNGNGVADHHFFNIGIMKALEGGTRKNGVSCGNVDLLGTVVLERLDRSDDLTSRVDHVVVQNARLALDITDERGDLGSVMLGALFVHDGDARVRKIGKLLRRFRTTQIGAHYA